MKSITDKTFRYETAEKSRTGAPLRRHPRTDAGAGAAAEGWAK